MRNGRTPLSEVRFQFGFGRARQGTLTNPNLYIPKLRQFRANQRPAGSNDSGIMKWPTSAVCFGPPLGQSELLVCTERELRTGAGVGLENQGGALRADSPGV